MKKLILLLVVSAPALLGQATTIADTIRFAGPTGPGALINGRINISWTAFRASDGTYKPSGNFNLAITNGVLNVTLESTTNATPAGSVVPGIFYLVRYYLTNGNTRTENWQFAYSATSITMAGVSIVSAVPTSVGFASTQIQQSGATDGQTLVWRVASNAWVPEAPSGGAPTTVTFITQTPSASLSAEQAMSLLGTGLVKNTTTTGVQSIAAPGTDYVIPGGNVATATALAANGANCSGGSYPLGVDAAGAAEGCTAAGSGSWGGITGTLSDQTDLNTALGLKAPLADPAFTGTATIGTTVTLDGTTNGLTVGSKIGGVTLSGLTGPVKFTAGVPSIALAADFTDLFSGTCPSGATCVPATDGTKQVVSAFPYAYQRGTILGVGLNLDTGSARITNPFSQTSNLPVACASAAAQYWQMPVGGFLRNITGTTGITNATTPIRWMLSPGCNNGTLLSSGGPVTVNGAAAGGVIDLWSNNQTRWWPISQWNPLGIGYSRTGGVTVTATPVHAAVEFISDNGLQVTILGAAVATALSASQTQYLGFGSGNPAASEVNTSVPIPVAGTLSNFFFTTTGTPTNTVAVALMKNTVATALVVTVGTTDNGAVNIDATHTAAIVAGDLVDVRTISGASTQATFQAMGVAFTPTTAGDTFIWGNMNGITVTTTNKYSLPLSLQTSTTIAAAQMTMPFACTASKLYVNQAAANGGSTVTTFTLMKNGSATAVTGTANVGVSGSIALDTANSVSYAAGDLLTLQFITNTGTSGAMGGWSVKCI